MNRRFESMAREERELQSRIDLLAAAAAPLWSRVYQLMDCGDDAGAQALDQLLTNLNLRADALVRQMPAFD